MVRRCVWGTCKADQRYPERLVGVRFIPFPQPKTNLEKCLRWIKACGRPHDQLNVKRIEGNRNKVICSTHFIGSNGPTEQHPDPIPADGGRCTPSRPLPKKRHLLSMDENHKKMRQDVDSQENIPPMDTSLETPQNRDQASNTEEKWVSPLDILSLTVELECLKMKIRQQNQTIQDLEQRLHQTEKERQRHFGVTQVMNNKTNHENLFKHYTGITYERFSALLAFLIPTNFTLNFEKGRSDIKSLSNEDGLFLTLIRYRRNLSLADLAMKFGLTIQSAGSVFNTWTDHIYFKLGQLSIWPHRDTIIKNMPLDFKGEFPSTLIIIDGTELKTQTPCALGLQSQFYSEYKSSTTLKALIGCDPRGSVMFVSELFSGSISDKAITEQSGFFDLLQKLKSLGHIHDGDAIMADKGFTISDELESLKLKLNIPPFARGGRQLTPGEISQTNKIAKHRIHIERLIAKVKKFLIVQHVIPTNMFSKINKIWANCCLLTLYQDIFVKDKQPKR